MAGCHKWTVQRWHERPSLHEPWAGGGLRHEPREDFDAAMRVKHEHQQERTAETHRASLCAIRCSAFSKSFELLGSVPGCKDRTWVSPRSYSKKKI